MVHIEAIPAFSDNYIWLIQGSGENWVVDPGDAQPVIDRLDALGVELTGVIITHHHFDHTGGLAELTARYSPTIIAPHNPTIEPAHLRVGEGGRVQCAGLNFRVMEVPGHTMDHIAYFSDDLPDQPVLLCGDTLFAGGCGRVFEGNPPMMLASLEKLAELPPATRCYCAHEYTMANLAFAQAVEPANQDLQARLHRDQQARDNQQPTVPSTLGDELATNPFLRCANDSVVAAAKERAPRCADDTASVFTVIREWKNNF